MQCRTCKKEIGNKDWIYCPFCAKSISKKPFYSIGMKDIADKLLNNLQNRLTRELLKTISTSFRQERSPKNRGFSVKIIANHQHTPTVIKQTTKAPKTETDMTTAKVRPVPKETIEPETIHKTMQDKHEIIIELPGIVNLEDIDILEFENSCEIRAYTDSTLYFKILEINQNLNLTKKNLDNEKLFLEFTN